MEDPRCQLKNVCFSLSITQPQVRLKSQSPPLLGCCADWHPPTCVSHTLIHCGLQKSVPWNLCPPNLFSSTHTPPPPPPLAPGPLHLRPSAASKAPLNIVLPVTSPDSSREKVSSSPLSSCNTVDTLLMEFDYW